MVSKDYMTIGIQEDVSKFWEKYREDNNIESNIILTVIDVKGSLNMSIQRLINMFIDEIIRTREFQGKSILQPKGDEEDE